MSLSAARCILRTMFSGKISNSLSVNIVTFKTLQCHEVQLKWSQLNTVIVSRKIQLPYVTNLYVSTSTPLKMSKDYYNILGVPKDASQKQIKNAYYKLAMKHHPDKNQGNLTQKYREIKEAYDILSNESSRMKYNNSSGNYSNTSNDWSSNSSYSRYNPYAEYKWRNSRTEYRGPKRESNYDYSNVKPFNVFINVITVPKNVVKVQVDILLLTFIKNRTLKMIMFHLFQFLWSQILKNVNYNVLINSNLSSNSLAEFISGILGYKTVRFELTEIEAIKGKAVRVNVNDNEKVLVVNIPRGVQRNQSFYLFYLIDDDDKNSANFKI